MLKRIKQMLRNYNLIPCKCGCRDDHWETTSIDGGQISEAKVVCDNCGTVVNYWAYGCIQFPETYTGLMKAKWESVCKFIVKWHLYRG